MKNKIIGMIMFLAVAIAQGARADVDLDLGYPLSERFGELNSLSTTESPFSLFSTIDVSDGFPEVPNQKPLGACQSFAMAAWLEYIFYYKSGHIVDLSEKHLAYNLLKFMTDEFWDAESGTYPEKYLGKSYLDARPTLGSGVAPFMLESYFQSAAIPDGVYSFGDMVAEEGLQNLDLETYEKYFDNNNELYSKDVYADALNEAFLLEPPTAFIYKIKRTNFSTGEEETVKVRSATEVSVYLGLTRDNVITYYNKDYKGYQQPLSEEVVIDLMKYFDEISQHFNQVSNVSSGNEIETAIIESLDKRMAVMIASNVWMGGWDDGTVFNKGGGHAMVVVGYQKRDGKTYFKLRNSWGKNRLVHGYNYIDSDTLIANTLYIVTHQIQ